MTKFNILICLLLCIQCAEKKKFVKKEILIDFEKITSQSHGGQTEESFILVKSELELKKHYAQLNITRKPGIPIPKVNFDKERVVILYLGEKNSGGYSIVLESAKKTSVGLVELVIKKTKPTGMATMAITQPYIIYKINKPIERVSFINIE